VTQVVFDNDDAAQMVKAKRLRSEYVVGVRGTVRRRSPETTNPKLETGEVEVFVQQLTLLNEAKTPPFPIADETPVSEDVRLKYRYLDLRRPRLANNMILRHKVAAAVRRYFDANGFLEIETPILTKSTPEGARDYLVPSRVHPGEFFALPQSPQLFKQILMIAGVDRYVQICKCFRDEDLRADRQPEFTQVDVEMSFARPETVFGIIEPLMRDIFKVIGRDITIPFSRMSYADAMAKYGSDKPDLRRGSRSRICASRFRESNFRVFKEIVAKGGTVRGFVIPKASHYSRSEVDGIVDMAKQQLGATGLVWARRADDGAITSSVMKAMGEDEVRRLLDATSTAMAVSYSSPPASTTRHRSFWDSCGSFLRKRTGCCARTSLRSRGSWTFLCWSGTRRRNATTRCTIRSRRRLTKIWTSSSAIPAISARRPTTSSSTAVKSAAAASVSTIPQCSDGSSRSSTSATKRRDSGSDSSSRRSNTGRPHTAASRSASTGLPRSLRTRARSAK
jgi:aspartyl-tRNA synthetase